MHNSIDMKNKLAELKTLCSPTLSIREYYTIRILNQSTIDPVCRSWSSVRDAIGNRVLDAIFWPTVYHAAYSRIQLLSNCKLRWKQTRE